LTFSKKQPAEASPNTNTNEINANEIQSTSTAEGSISNDSQTTPNDIATPLQQSLSEARLQQRAEVVKRIAENSSHSDRYAPRFIILSFIDMDIYFLSRFYFLRVDRANT
jgi:hypothetical protein